MSSGAPYSAPNQTPAALAPHGRANVAAGALCDMSAPTSEAVVAAGGGWPGTGAVVGAGRGDATTSPTPTSEAASTESAMGWLRAMRYSLAAGSK